MLTFELQNTLNQFLMIRERADPFFSLLHQLASAHDSALKQLVGIAEAGQSLQTSATNLHSNFANVQGLLRNISVREVMIALGKLEKELGKLSDIDDSTSNAINTAKKAVSEVGTALDNFLAKGGALNGWNLLREAKNAHIQLEMLDDTFLMVVELLDLSSTQLAESASLSILMQGSSDLAGLIKRLSALQGLYSELCMLLNVSEAEYPLTIGKIETGSLWAKVFGEPRVIGLMVDFVESAAKYLYRTYTREGRIVAIPAKVESLDRIIELRGKLQDLNIKTDEIDEVLAKGAYAIAHDLTSLLERQPAVTVNGSKISIGDDELARRLAEEEWPKLIGPDVPSAANGREGTW